MSPFRFPGLFRPRRSFYPLRSFHLSPAQAAAEIKKRATLQVSIGDVKTHTKAPSDGIQMSSRLSTIPLRGSTITTLALITSLIFICTISFAFIGAGVDEPYLQYVLARTAETSPGIVLVGESVDVDVDEPSITIRWSILACGEDFILPGSAGIRGNNLCGLPANPLYIYVDGRQEPTATYDPSQIPFNRDTGHRRSIQNIVQFDSDHTLDVHEAYLYPFDTYVLSSTLRAVSFANQTLPIRKLATIDMTSSFLIETADMDSYSTSANNIQEASRDIDLRVRRPGEARAFALLLFVVSWVLAHVTVGHVIIARRLVEVKSILKHLISAGAILIAIPQLRNSMPDAPGLDGVLIDSIGFFPQMIITGVSVISLLLLLLGLELDLLRHTHSLSTNTPPPSTPPPDVPRPSPPPTPTTNSGSMEIAQYELHRLVKHLRGEYVFPPVKSSYVRPSSQVSVHRRSKTMAKITETGEVPPW